MLTQLYPFLDPAYITPDHSRRLRDLADDCDRLGLDRQISSSLLLSAPVLNRWLPVLSPRGIELTGHVIGHPVLGNGFVGTSQLWFASPDDTWVRTLSRFYRLGSPASPKDATPDFGPPARDPGSYGKDKA